MKILITGGSGFIGSWVARMLSKEHEVTILTRLNSSLYKTQGIINLNVVSEREDNWHEIVKKISPDIIILSDWWGVENKYRNDMRQYDNVDRFISIVDASVNCGVKKIIGVGSQAELGPVNNQIFEHQVDNPTTKYADAKVEARKYLLNLGSATSDSVWLRIFSAYGPLDTGDWLIPKTVRTLQRNEKMHLTEGEQEWSYLYITDLVAAFSTAVNSNLHGIVNVGNPNTYKIRDVAEAIGRHLGKQHLLNFGAVPYREDQVMLMSPACETLMSQGWHPKVGLEEGIRETVSWLLGNPVKNLFYYGIPPIKY
jgi:nucleoside-diphosphate-sugar epimerase